MVGFDRSITNRGSVSTNVTIYALFPINLTEYIFSPGANPSTLPTMSRFSSSTYKLFVLSWLDTELSVVAILKNPLSSSIEN